MSNNNTIFSTLVVHNKIMSRRPILIVVKNHKADVV